MTPESCVRRPVRGRKVVITLPAASVAADGALLRGGAAYR